MTTIDLPLDPPETHILTAALAMYRGALAHDRRIGGVAAEMAETLDPIAGRIERRLYKAMYGTAEPVEPDWALGLDPIDAAKAEAARWDPALAAGDHHVGVGL